MSRKVLDGKVRKFRWRAAGFEKCEIKNVTGHRNVRGYDEGNSDHLQQMSAPITNDAYIQNKNDSCVETPSSASSSVYHHVNNNNAASSIFSSKPLPSKNFSFGIEWKSAPSVHHYDGKVYNLNNYTNVLVKCKTQPYRKPIRII